MSGPEILFKLLVVLGKSVPLVVTGYTLFSMIAVLVWRVRRRPSPPAFQPVSILKPLHGDEPELYENLRSFCIQDYAEYQLVFGVRDSNDPALKAVERLLQEFPRRDIVCVSDPAVHGSNRKVSNLINIERRSRHDWLVLADSDIRVGPDYLQRVVAPLAQAETGVVTCLYRGRPLCGLWSRLGALFINEWFGPMVLLGHLFGSGTFGFGATIALRRKTLQSIGGFPALANYLADDYRISELARECGLRTVLSDYVVETTVTETSAAELMRHELRWLRTIRTIQPTGYLLIFMTFGLPLVMLACALPDARPLALPLLAVAASARAVMHCWPVRRRLSSPMTSLLTLPLLPLRDLFSLCAWAASFTSRRVDWAGHSFTVAEDGIFRDSTHDSHLTTGSFRDVEHDHSERV